MLYVDLESNTLWAGHKRKKLTLMEAEFLYIMIENIGRVMSYERIAIKLWGHRMDEPANIRNSINQHVYKARRLFESMELPVTIEHYWSHGLRLIFGETDPDDEYIAKCLKHRKSIEAFLKGQNRAR